MSSIEKYKHLGLTIRIKQDTDPCNPRTEYDGHLGTMVCWHGRYELGDEQPGRDHDASAYKLDLAIRHDEHLEDFIYKLENISRPKGGLGEETWDSYYDRMVTQRIRARVVRVLEQHYLFLPLYLFDHSGLRISTTDFNDRWDSGQVGFIYVSKAKVLKMYGNGAKRLSPKLRQQALTYLEGEVETYDDYLSGNVYGFTIKRKGSGEGVLDSCWGFFGDIKYVKQEAEAAAAALAEEPEPEPTPPTFGSGDVAKHSAHAILAPQSMADYLASLPPSLQFPTENTDPIEGLGYMQGRGAA